MKVVLLAGGLGTRLSEETGTVPKPMVEIGNMPILWHIMKEYSFYGYNEFIICAGYKQQVIKQWFRNYFLYKSDITFDFTSENRIIVHDQTIEPWKVTVVDTGMNTMTGGRIKRVQKYIGDEPFLMTYGDGVCDVDVNELVKFHKENNKIATLTSVVQQEEKGTLDVALDNSVKAFREKERYYPKLINAGYMVLEPQIFNYINGDKCIFEKDVLPRLAEEGQLMSYRHEGFWQCMDTLFEKQKLEQMIEDGKAPWIRW